MSDLDIAGYDWDPPDEPEPAQPAAAQVPPSALPELKTLLSLAVAAIVIAALYLAKRVLIEITLAVMLSFVLTPLVNLLRRLGLWRTPSVLLSVLLALGVIGGLGAVIASQATVLTDEAPRYANVIQRKADGARTFLTKRFTTVSGLFRVPRAASERTDAPESAGAAGDGAVSPLSPMLVQLAPTETSAMGVARSVLEPILVPLETTIIVIVLVGFILLQKEDLRDRFIRLFGRSLGSTRLSAQWSLSACG
jgi:predicted PurR-regulated permease PerM